MGEKLRYSGFSRHFALSFFRSDLKPRFSSRRNKARRDQPEAATESTTRARCASKRPEPSGRRARARGAGPLKSRSPCTPADGEDERPLYISTLNERWKPSSASSAALTCRSFPR